MGGHRAGGQFHGPPAVAEGNRAELQRVLELSGRTLQLGATNWLTESNAASNADLLYMAQFEDASRSTTLLSDMGFTLEERIITPTVTAPATTPPAGRSRRWRYP